MSLDNSNIKYNRSDPQKHKIFSIQDVVTAEKDTGLKFGELLSIRAQKDRELWNKIATILIPG